MSEKLRRIDPSLLGQLISTVGKEPNIATFGSLVFDAVRTLAPFQLASMVVYHERGGARCLHHNFVEDEHVSGLERYINYTYVLNPVYAAYQLQSQHELEGVSIPASAIDSDE
ncbi:hypothetical protein [Pseudomonas juntendi]|uniref:hypothetical protein n=1 Tax=Pseudomonas juntendi TaxID=2666183 RepID=UPI001F218C5C|nr:hypothetical protein [Pseudomonas juntendi]